MKGLGLLLVQLVLLAACGAHERRPNMPTPEYEEPTPTAAPTATATPLP